MRDCGNTPDASYAFSVLSCDEDSTPKHPNCRRVLLLSALTQVEVLQFASELESVLGDARDRSQSIASPNVRYVCIIYVYVCCVCMHVCMCVCMYVSL